MSSNYEMLPATLSGPAPKVSVWMITYNHEKYVAQALDSVIAQNASFPFEIVVGEDCSSDKTREILLHYQTLYPNIIRLLLWHKNAGMMLNAVRTQEACRGEYIAYCEGDDYWTDPQKLQRQVDELDAHPELSLCHHRVNYVQTVDGLNHVIQDFPPVSNRGRRNYNDLIAGNFIQTCSLMIRKKYLPITDDEFLSLKLGDWPTCYLAAENGDIGYIDICMADYRIHHGNNWHKLAPEIRSLEAAKMALYLARVAKIAESQAEWKNRGVYNLKQGMKHLSFMRCLKVANNLRKSRSLSRADLLKTLFSLLFSPGRLLRNYPTFKALLIKKFRDV